MRMLHLLTAMRRYVVYIESCGETRRYFVLADNGLEAEYEALDAFAGENPEVNKVDYYVTSCRMVRAGETILSERDDLEYRAACKDSGLNPDKLDAIGL